MIDPSALNRLNEAERRVLEMLAMGHTSKSIALETGASVHSVNERLREARRKTGAASSRELARLLSPQKNRDENIGIARVPGFSDPPAAAPIERRSQRRLIVAVLSIGAGVAALLLATQPVPPAEPPRVVKASPTAGDAVSAGRIVVTVTFDRPMRQGSYSFVILDPRTYPECGGTPRQSLDRRTFVLTCDVEADRSYAVGINYGQFINFRDDRGASAAPFVVRFHTK